MGWISSKLGYRYQLLDFSPIDICLETSKYFFAILTSFLAAGHSPPPIYHCKQRINSVKHRNRYIRGYFNRCAQVLHQQF